LEKSVPNTQWKRVKLGDLFDFKNGVNAEKSSYGTGTPFINVMDIFRSDILTQVDVRGKVEISNRILEENSAVYGDIFFNRTSETPGEIAFSSIYMGTEKITFGGFVIRARPITNKLTPAYGKYCFKPSSVRKELIRRGQGAVRGNIGQKDLEKVEIVLPTLEEQKRIITVLEVSDQYLNGLNRKLELSKRIRNKLTTQLVTGTIRLRDFSDAWQQKTIGDIARNSAKLNAGQDNYEVLSCTKHDGLVRSLEYFKRKVYGDDLAKYKLVPRNHFAYATNHIEEGSIGYQNLLDVGLVSPMYTIFKTTGVNDTFLYKLLKTPRMISEYKRHMTASVARRGGLRWVNFSKIKIALPSRVEQDAIADILSTLDQEIELLGKKQAIARQQRTYLIEKLVEGEIRIPENLKAPSREISYA
jgi:type I restriction enzyme S subunit